MKKKILSVILGVAMAASNIIPVMAATVPDVSSDGSANSNVDVVFNQSDTIELSLSTNEVNFGDVTGLTHKEEHSPETLTASVKSSLPYNLDIKALSNFEEQNVSADSTAKEISINKLGTKLDSGSSYTKFDGINKDINLVSAAPATYDLESKQQDYNIKFDLDNTIGEKTGSYKTSLQVTATQN